MAILLPSSSLSFNRTSFQQQLKREHQRCFKPLRELQSYILSTTTETVQLFINLLSIAASIVHPFNNNWNRFSFDGRSVDSGFNRTSFQQQLKQEYSLLQKRQTVRLQSYILSTTTETLAAAVGAPSAPVLQSYILSTTTETRVRWRFSGRFSCFNRTSFQQQLKLVSS